MLDIKTLETWLWNAACSIRGAVDTPKYKGINLFQSMLSELMTGRIRVKDLEISDE